jgi:hypothetical protein
MTRSLTHLPPERAERLREIRDVVRDATGDSFAMLILFGSYARGDWVDEEYQEATASKTPFELPAAYAVL